MDTNNELKHLIWGFVVAICFLVMMTVLGEYNDRKTIEYAMDKGYIQKIDTNTYRTIWVKDDN